jgi:hypothetical protein
LITAQLESGTVKYALHMYIISLSIKPVEGKESEGIGSRNIYSCPGLIQRNI